MIGAVLLVLHDDYNTRCATADAEFAGAHVPRASDRQRVQHQSDHSQAMAGRSLSCSVCYTDSLGV